MDHISMGTNPHLFLNRRNRRTNSIPTRLEIGGGADAHFALQRQTTSKVVATSEPRMTEALNDSLRASRLDLLRRRLLRVSLYWRVFALNATLLILGVAFLAATPATISHPLSVSQSVMLVIATVVALAANALLLRISFRPLRDLSRLMDDIDLLRPGQRLGVAGTRELTAVTDAFNEMLERLEQERRQSTVRSLDDHETERLRISNELHDEVAQGLTGLLLLLAPVIDDAPNELRQRLEKVQHTARQTLDEVRLIARQLRPTVLDDLGLGAALATLCGVVEQSSDLVIRQRVDDELPELSSEAELTLYRIAQEALTNVVRHASASRVDLELRARPSELELRISDDGRGMHYAGAVEGGGLRGIRERAVAIGAHIAIDSEVGKGTTISVSVETSRRS